MVRMAVAERRRRLLTAAFAVISRSGVAGATTRAVVDEAGMKLASFHYAFESREELLTALVEEVVGAQGSVLEVTPGDAGSLEAVLESGLLQFFDGVRDDPLRERAMFELTQYAMRMPGMAPLAARQYERYRDLARAALEEAARRTGTHWRAPVQQVAAHLVALTDGVTLAWLADGDSDAARSTLRFAARSLAAEADISPLTE